MDAYISYKAKNMSKSIIIIPSRLEAKRLPNKPLLKINNIPMIIHVIKILLLLHPNDLS